LLVFGVAGNVEAAHWDCVANITATRVDWSKRTRRHHL